MYENKKVYYVGTLLAIMFLCLGIGIFCLLFVGGTHNISTDTGDLLNKWNNETVPYEWLLETSGFATVHHVKNFQVAFYLSTSNIYLILYPATTKVILHGYGTSILKTLGWAAAYEIIEKFVVFVFDLLGDMYPENAPIVFASDWIGTGEVAYNSILSDLSQAVFASTGLCVLIYFIGIRVPSEILIKRKPIIIIIIQFAWIGVSGLCSFMIIYKKETSIGTIPVGFYAYFFIELFFITTLYLGDFYYIECNTQCYLEEREKSKKMNKLMENFKRRKEIMEKEEGGLEELKRVPNTNENTKIDMSIKELNEAYLIFVFYLLIQWVAAFGLHAPGFITSNVIYVIFILFLLSLWKRF